ncbi:MAG: nickel pincer cofactor biosynthesis protein LarB [Planctomycetota bacterium]
MKEETLRGLLVDVRNGSTSVDEAIGRLRSMPFEDLGFAKVDHHRAIRCGFPEVIYCEGKTAEQVGTIFGRCASTGANVLATRASVEAYQSVALQHPNAVYQPTPRMITFRQVEARTGDGMIAIVAAGTSDLPVAEEARITAEMMDQRTSTFYDVGVAGIHRLLAHTEAVQKASVVVVVAGMEGALASVVGGLVNVPVVAVPTSIGYGASFGGVAALLAMLNSCAANVTVVNIDNGFGAGYCAALINRRKSVSGVPADGC